MEQQSQIGRSLNVVAIGGGTGLATLLSGLKDFVGHDENGGFSIAELSAIVAVTDDGGSSGRLRDELQMPPPGDIRNCVVALSEDAHLLSRLFRYRFTGNGDLGGHSFGNIFLAALSEMTGDFAEAVRLSSEILASKGRIFPATTANVRLGAMMVDGSVVRGETNISKVGPMIERLFLEPEDCVPLAGAIEAIGTADLITIGPGSLYTSIVPPLLVGEIAAAIESSPAKCVFINNLMTQPGETDGFTTEKHLDVVRQHASNVKFDHVILNCQPISDEQRQKYLAEGSVPIALDGPVDKASRYGAEFVYANLLEDGEMVRHDPRKLAEVVLTCVAANEVLPKKGPSLAPAV